MIVITPEKGLVMKCSTDADVEPSVVAQKVYYYTRDKNMTESELINVAVSDAGVRPKLYWFHDKGFFEEYLGHKEDLNKHPLQMYQRPVLEKVAQNLAEMHKVSIPDINQGKYKEWVTDGGQGAVLASLRHGIYDVTYMM